VESSELSGTIKCWEILEEAEARGFSRRTKLYGVNCTAAEENLTSKK
jgi:hypothetical protein